MASDGFAHLLGRLLGSLRDRGECADAARVVFVPDGERACAEVAAAHAASVVRYVPIGPRGPGAKALLYSVARVVEAEEYLCLDADMMILDSLEPVFHTLATSAPRTIAACREVAGGVNLHAAMESQFHAPPRDLTRLTRSSGKVACSTLVVNDGLFAGRRDALLALDTEIRAMPRAGTWINERRDLRREKAVFNVALAQLDCGLELDARYNVQLHRQVVERHVENGRVDALVDGRRAAVLHFNRSGRRFLDAWTAA